MIRNGYKDTRFLALQQKKTEDNGIQMLKSIGNHTAMYIFLYIIFAIIKIDIGVICNTDL